MYVTKKIKIILCLVIIMFFYSCTYEKKVYYMDRLDYVSEVIIGTNIKHGKAVLFSYEGDTIVKSEYRYGRLHGKVIEYYNSGCIHQVLNYKKGELSGSSYYYYPNGLLNHEVEYKDSRIWNLIMIKDIKGNKLEKGTLYNGNGTIFKYDSLGLLKEKGCIENGLKNGYWTRISNTGHVDSTYYKKGIHLQTNLKSILF